MAGEFHTCLSSVTLVKGENINVSVAIVTGRLKGHTSSKANVVSLSISLFSPRSYFFDTSVLPVS